MSMYPPNCAFTWAPLTPEPLTKVNFWLTSGMTPPSTLICLSMSPQAFSRASVSAIR